MPLFINFTGPASYDYVTRGASFYNVTRDYLARLYVLPVGSGEVYQAEKLVKPLIAQWLLTMGAAARAKLLLDDVQRARLTGDTGVQVLGYFGQEFVGVEFAMSITTLERLTCPE